MIIDQTIEKFIKQIEQKIVNTFMFKKIKQKSNNMVKEWNQVHWRFLYTPDENYY